MNGLFPGRRPSVLHSVEVLGASLQPKGAGLLYSSQHLLVQHGEGWIRWQVQAVKAGVSSAGTTGSSAAWTQIQILVWADSLFILWCFAEKKCESRGLGMFVLLSLYL